MFDRQFHAVLDGAPDGVLIESGDRVVYLNSAYAKMLGYAAVSELDSVCIRDIAHPEEVERLQWFGRCRSEGKPAPTRYSFRACGRSGDVVTLDASISAARVDGDLLITTIVRRTDAVPPLEVPGVAALSPREHEVIDYLLAGRRSKEIALLLDVSDKTIWTHRCRAFQKLGVQGLADLFRLVNERRAGFSPPQPG
ncbi:MAG TPA: LuxR C-terminal-related transcriptional regulator [Thermoanaerobaculia bacterium]